MTHLPSRLVKTDCSHIRIIPMATRPTTTMMKKTSMKMMTKRLRMMPRR